MIYKKSAVLTSVCGGKEKAVVTLECDGGETIGNVRLYNFDKEPDGVLSLGFLSEGNVLKAGLVRENNAFYTFKMAGQKNLNAFSCALVNFAQGEAKPLLMGASGGVSKNEEKLCNSLCIFDQKTSVESVTSVLNENEIYLEEQEEIDRLIECEINEDCESKCADCKYRDAFFKLEDDMTPAPEPQPTFYDDIKEQIDTLFEKYPEEEILKQIIPDSKWVKIDYEEKGEYYVVGLLYEDGKIKYVCYGVPSIYSNEPPEDIKGFSQWLPVDSERENGFGYWITYQDAKTGENVKLNYEVV